MRNFTAIIEREADSDMLVAYVPGFPGAHAQGRTTEELNQRLTEVIQMLLEDGEPQLQAEFVGTQNVKVA
ncbi:MAG: type II toxin-antitoxin system HicB family antitoxin [Burkholderiales bacterium]|nr:type II toxin-antitoxin system HicB family antitoxin [Phycisphaerae bacterium]